MDYDEELPVARVAVPSPSTFTRRSSQEGNQRPVSTNDKNDGIGDSKTSDIANTTATMTKTTLLGSPDNRRVEKLESGVLDLSARELSDHDLHGVAQLVDVCSVHSLGLAYNRLTALTTPLPSRLVVLDVSNNSIQSLAGRGLSQLTGLQTLIASHNQLEDMQGLEPCLAIKSVDLSHNNIESVIALPQHRDLYSLDLSFNQIRALDNIRTLAHLHMQCLHLRGNPIATGSGYRLVVSHMLPTVRCLDDVLQAPSPYIHRDSLSDSPARRFKAHKEATGLTESVSTQAREYWAKKPNKVQVSSKKSLSYATIHKRRTEYAAAASMSGSGKKKSASLSDQEEGMHTPQPKQKETVLNKGAKMPRSFISTLSPPGKVPSRVSPRRDQVHTGFASSVSPSNLSNKRGSRGTPDVPSIAQKMSEALLHERRLAKSGSDGRNDVAYTSLSPPSKLIMANVKIPRVEYDHTLDIPPPAPASASNNAMPDRSQKRASDHEHARPFTKSTESVGTTYQRVQSTKTSLSKKTTKISQESLNRLSKTSGRLKRSKVKKRPGQIETAFGRTYDKDDRYALSSTLTPHTYNFASNLRDSARKGDKKKTVESREVARHKGIQPRGRSRPLKRQSEREGGSEARKAVSSAFSNRKKKGHKKRNDSSVFSPSLEGSARNDKAPTPANTPNTPRVKVSLRSGSKRRQDPQSIAQADSGEKEWNEILQSLIDQKRRSLALLYRSLSNETESQSRMVSSQSIGPSTDNMVQSIHIDRQGAISYT